MRTSPKSQILRSQFAFNSRLDGLRSRWSTPAEWINLSPRSTFGGNEKVGSWPQIQVKQGKQIGEVPDTESTARARR